MKNNFLKYLMLGCSAMVFLNACVKDKYSPNQAAGQGPSYVRITEGKLYAQYFSPFLTLKQVTMFSVRKDAASNDALQASNTVVLTDITNKQITRVTSAGTVTKSYIEWFDIDNGGLAYSAMPSSLYTFVAQPGVVATGTGFTFNFGPGDFAKNVIFSINGALVDLSKQYAVAYVVTNTGGLTQKVGLDTIIAGVAIKNKYDGVYTTAGSMVDITNTTLGEFNNFLGSANNTTGVAAPQQIELRTTSANTCDVYDNYFFGGYYYPIASGTSYSQYGNFCPSLTFDLATDKITAVVNHYGQNQAAAGRSGRLDPTGTINAYVNGKITIKFNMTQPQAWNGNPTNCPLCSNVAPYVRSTWDEVWTFKSSR